MKKLLFLLPLALLPGCAQISETYKKIPGTPDGFNLTDYRQMGQPVRNDVIGVGLSWSLK